MKKITYIIALSAFSLANAQVFVNGTSAATTEVTNSSVLMEFRAESTKELFCHGQPVKWQHQ